MAMAEAPIPSEDSTVLTFAAFVGRQREMAEGVIAVDSNEFSNTPQSDFSGKSEGKHA